jgi:hypothetical protein
MAIPGMVPGKPTSTHGMTQKLGRHGIKVRTARNAALATRAEEEAEERKEKE